MDGLYLFFLVLVESLAVIEPALSLVLALLCLLSPGLAFFALRYLVVRYG